MGLGPGGYIYLATAYPYIEEGNESFGVVAVITTKSKYLVAVIISTVML